MGEIKKPNYFYLLFVVPLAFSFTTFYISSKHHNQVYKASIDVDMNAEQISNLIVDARSNWDYLRQVLPELQ